MHLIKKQLIELKLTREHNAFRMQHLISEHYRNEMIPALESVFNDYCNEDEVLILDRLEIDFGVISEKDIEKNRWNDDMLNTFKSSLLDNLAALSVNKKFIRRSKAMNSCRQWISYMQKGYLPWNTIAINDKWYEDVLETLATDYSGVAILRKLLLNEKTFAYRVAQQHNTDFLTKLVEVITAQSQKQLALAAEEVFTIIKQVNIYQHQQVPSVGFVKAIWQQLLVVASSVQKNFSTENIASAVLSPYSAKLPVQKKRQKELLSLVTVLKQVLVTFFEFNNSLSENKKLPDKVVIEQKGKKDITDKKGKNTLTTIDEDIPTANGGKTFIANKEDVKATKGKKITEQLQSNDTGKEERSFADTLPHDTTPGDKNQQDDKHNIDADAAKELQHQPINPIASADNMMEKILSQKNLGEKVQEEPSKLLRETIPPEGIFIQHAGLVLTHPFLSSLFKRLEWLRNNEFITDEIHVKAVFILHYLATGETVAAEHELLICKLLCGYPLDEPLPAEIIFTEAELQEATDMLTALIQQWDKLKNTSVAGLREGFLQRPGKLFIKNDSPYVQVESHAIDVLLDYLPWNLSMIKLPWLKEILRVEWR
jgi:hypothetical protein